MKTETVHFTMKLFTVFFLLRIPSVAAVIHSMMEFYTSSSEVKNVPEFVGLTMIDGVQTVHYDSNTRRAVPKQDWMNKITDDYRKFWEEETQRMKGNWQTSTRIIENAKQLLNHTEGHFIVEGMSGCEWDDETDDMNTFVQFGLNGEDFITLDLEAETWIAVRPKAVIIKTMLDNNKPLLALIKGFFTYKCQYRLKKFVNIGMSSLMRKELPSVALLQKTPSSPVTCHATGFYPEGADLFWKKDDEELHEDVVRGEILPNHDGTFQMSVDLDLSSVKDEDWRRYNCVFHLTGVKEDLHITLDQRVILTNWRREFPTAAVAAVVVVGVLLLAGCIFGLLFWRRNSHGFRRTNTSESSSSSGEDPAVKKRTSEVQTMLQT